MSEPGRCSWVPTGTSKADRRMRAYHDREWGVPVHDDTRLLEMLVLEGAQAGLSWATVLARRDGYRRAFAGFDAESIAGFDEGDRQRLLADPGIIRNRAKIDAAIRNARAFLTVREEHGSFDGFLWSQVGGEPRHNRFRRQEEVPAQTETSRRLSRALRQRDFAFVGPTIVYAFMQAVGMVNDHLLDCFRHGEV